MRPLDPRLLRYASRARRPIAGLAALGVITAGLVIIQAQLLATMIAGAFLGGASLRSLTASMLALAVVLVARAGTAWASAAVSGKASSAATAELRQRLLARAVSLGPSWLAGQRTAELAELATKGVDDLDGYFTSYLPKLFLAVAVPLAVLVRVAVADPWSGLTVAVTLPLVPVFGALIGLATAKRARARWRALGTLAHHFLDVVEGLPTLKVFGRAGVQRDSIRRVTDEYRRATMGTLKLAFLSAFALELIATTSVALVAVEIGLRLAAGSMDLRIGLLALILAPEAYLPLRNASAEFHATADGLAAANEVFAILESPAPAAPGSLATEPSFYWCDYANDADNSNRRLGRELRIRVENLSVRHPGRAEAAPEGLWLTVEPGRITALAGPSGCGKSTLLSVLLGFTPPSAGRVTAPGRELIGWVPQDPTLFPGTVADNIKLGWPDAPSRAVRAAAGAAALDDVPLDRVLADRGAGLSAGQRRRVALARALLPGPDGSPRPVLLLDEPTAGLDPQTEARVIAALGAEAARGRAILVVSHHPAVLAAADEVVLAGAREEVLT